MLIAAVVCCLAQESFESAEMVCDEAIRQWLLDRKKYASRKRNRTKWITKLNARKSILTPTKHSNTPKRSTNSLRRGRSSGPIVESAADVFSPVAPNMLRTPVAKIVHKKNENRKFKTKYKRGPNVCFLFVFVLRLKSFFVCSLCRGLSI